MCLADQLPSLFLFLNVTLKWSYSLQGCLSGKRVLFHAMLNCCLFMEGSTPFPFPAEVEQPLCAFQAPVIPLLLPTKR